ncbi:MAG TPA: galactokinase [Candidatus Acidoferrales bacterium]|nr:galactokinase [Candidatus Acidoferrales bacterium]
MEAPPGFLAEALNAPDAQDGTLAPIVRNAPSTVEQLTARFYARFGTSARIFRVPGRVNLIGEHTDYNDGFVMPAAIGFYTWVAGGCRPDRALTAYSELYDEETTVSLDDLSGPPRQHWSDFIRGLAATLLEAGYKLAGANLLIHGDVPVGAGLSSSASLEVAVALALTQISSVTPSRLELVKICQRTEHQYAGTRCGIMDQFAVSFAAAQHALMLDCRSLEYRLLPVPPDLRLVVCNSMVRRELASAEYNLRRSDCEAGVRLLQSHMPAIAALRDVEMKDLDRCAELLPERVYRRCRHVVSENSRVLKAASALEANDADHFGELMYQSHASLRDDYEVSCKELDLLVELASRVPGVYGARMTGGGFGGCTVNLVRAAEAASFQKQIAHEYSKQTGIMPSVHVCEITQGAEALPAAGSPALK